MADVNYVGKGWYEVRFSSDGDELTFKRVSPPDNPPNVSELDFVRMQQEKQKLLNEINWLRSELESAITDRNYWMNQAVSRP